MREKITGKVIPETAEKTVPETAPEILLKTVPKTATATVTETKHPTSTIQRKTESPTDTRYSGLVIRKIVGRGSLSNKEKHHFYAVQDPSVSWPDHTEKIGKKAGKSQSWLSPASIHIREHSYRSFHII